MYPEVYRRDAFLQGEIQLLTISNQDRVSLHQHDFLEIAYILDGEILHVMNGEETLLHKGNYFIVDYQAAHAYVPHGSAGCRLVNCLFVPELIDSALAGCRSFAALLGSYWIRFGDVGESVHPERRIFFDEDEAIWGLMGRMQSEFFQKKRGYVEILRCCLIEIIIRTVRKLALPAASGNGISAQIAEYLQAHFYEPVTLTALGRQLHYSVPYLSQTFRKAFGISFMEYLQQIRVGQSCRLLTDTNQSISEIAEAVGYGDVRFFNRVFRRRMQMTPRDYRKFARKNL